MKQTILTILFAFILGTVYGQTIEDKIGISLGQAFQTSNIDAFASTDEQIALVEDENQQTYWQAFSDFYKAIYYRSVGNQDKSKETNSQGIKLLQANAKTSEDYALLAYMQSFQMQFLPPAQLQTADSEFYTYIEKAKELDAENPRVYLVLGYYDMYKPIEYGGGTEYKSLFERAKELFATESEELPNWGQSDLENAMQE